MSGLPTLLVLGGIMLVALALRLPSFGDSLWGDELSTNFVVNGFGVGSLLHLVDGNQEGTPPLFFMLVWLTKWIDGAEGLRVISLVAGLAAIPLTYALGVRTVGSRAGWVAAALIAFSPFQIFYSTEARAYALSMAITLVVAIALLQAIGGRHSKWWWGAYAVSTAAAAYTHYTTVFVLAGIAIWSWFAHPEHRRALLLANVAAIILFLPWSGQLIADRDEPAAKIIEFLSPLTVSSAKRDLGHLYFGHPYIPIGDVPGHLGAWLVALGAMVGAVGVTLRRRSERSWPWPPSAVALVVVIMLAAPVGAILHNFVAPSVFSPRNLITSWPGFALTLGAVVTAGRIPFRVAAIGMVVVGYGIGAVMMLDAQNRRPDLDGAAHFIEDSGGPMSPVVELPQGSPGIQSPMEAALAPRGQGVPDRPVYVLTYPTFDTRRRLAGTGDGIVFASAAVRPSPQAYASEAANDAGEGRLFLVYPGDATVAQSGAIPGPVADFLGALPPRFHEVGSRTFPGLADFGVSVAVFDGSGGEGS